MAAAAKPAFRPVQLKPLTGGLDTRSLPEELKFGTPRLAQHLMTPAPGRLCRRPGWERLLAETTGTYNNQDLHDQLFSYPPQPIQFLYEAISISGVHRLLAGTQNRIYALDDSSGNWQVLSDQLGGAPLTSCSSTRWRAAQIEDDVVFTNGQDPPVYWVFDGSTTSNNQSVQTISDLGSTGLNVSKVDVLCAWKGVMFYANVVADGVRVNHRVMWSDFKKPLSLSPTSGSVAGFQDLGYGEDILAMAPLNNSLLIYTTRGIWECDVGDPTTTIFTFTQRYGQANGFGCLTYRHTLINTGVEHIYMSRDGIYAYNLYTPTPIRTPWVHSASGSMYDTIDGSRCDLHYAGWNASTQEAWFSWTKVGDSCPSSTLVLDTQYQFADILPQGFTAFANYRPSNGATVADYLTSNCICTPDDLTILNGNTPLLGGLCARGDPPLCDAVFTSLYTDQTEVVLGFDALIEDATFATYAAGSLYAVLQNVTINDLCNAELESDQCNADQKFVGVLSVDNCIKQYGNLYGYERCVTRAACATYVIDGYTSILRSGPLDLESPENQKVLRRFLVDYQAVTQTIPSSVVVRVGFSRQPSDPNTDNCPIAWQTLTPKPLRCASIDSEANYTATNKQPYRAMEWPIFLAGRYLYWELSIAGTGGQACFAAISMDIATKPKGI